MNKHDLTVKLYEEMDKIVLDNLREFEAVIRREKLSLLNAAEESVTRLKETGLLTLEVNDTLDALDTMDTRINNKQGLNTTTSRSGSLKENVPENHGRSVRNSTRPKRNALAESTPLSNVHAHNTTSNKDTDEFINNLAANVTVKMEKLSAEFIRNMTDLQNSKIGDLNVKKEINEMPPPSKPPVRQTRRRKATQNADLEARNVKVEQIDKEQKKEVRGIKLSSKQSSITRDSDVQIQCEPIDTVSLVDSEEEAEKPRTRGRTKVKKAQNKDQNSNSDQGNESETQTTTRATRTKTRNAAKNKQVEDNEVMEKQKRFRSPSSEVDSKPKKTKASSKRDKTDENKQNGDHNASVYEDAMSAVSENAKDVTYVDKTNKNKITPPNGAILNETVVLEKPKNPTLMNETVVINKAPGNDIELKDIMTDDEDVVASSPKGKKTKLKQVFSPYANSPVKQRVQAYEKLHGEANNCDLPPRMTRTKTKAKAKERQEINENSNETTQPNNVIPSKGAIPKVKHSPIKKGSIPVLKTTPVFDNRLLKHPHTADKYKQQKSFLANQSNSTENISIIGKPRSAIKASQAEFRERELKRKQKESEALSKKEAMIQALTEERKRRREERQLKAQQTRDALEKDKQKTLESVERIKQEKLKQMLAEKEEKLLKQREEAARKRALAQKKAAEEKQKEEQRQLEQEKAAKKMRNKDNLPPYLKYETPMLPTEDCYDSDDSNAGRPISVAPWQKKEAVARTLRYMRYVEKQKRNLFFGGPTTVNLQEIFPSIEPHKLKRTSSAIWNKSGLSKLTSLVEEEEG